VVAVATAALFLLVARLASRREQLFALPIAALLAIALLVIGQHDTTDAWSEVQTWVRDNTPDDAVFLTPIQPGGFRLESQRAVVGEWRDGTQLYFSAGFAPQWWRRMLDLQPGLLTDASGRNILSTGRPLSSLDDEAVVALARKYGASHVVMRKQPNRELPVAYSNGEFAVYLPQLPPPVAPAEATDKDRWLADEKFMRETVLPNIDKYRKGDAKLHLLDADGRPLAGATVEVRQVASAFNFSASLPFFQAPAGAPSNGDFVPPPVDPRELVHFREIFNASMIPFSGKWMYVEPREGELHFEDLDHYVDWCTQNHIRLEYHFLSGYFAPWVKQKNPQQQGEAFLRHAKQIAERYGDRIPYWQVVNETILIQQSPPVFKMLRQMMPNAKLGISDCAKFAPETKSKRRIDMQSDMIRGLAEVRWLKGQGIQPDFFGFHGHRPFGIWPEASQMYASLDLFAKEGVKVHITEFTVPQDTPIISPIRGGRFTPEVQAQFYERFFTVCFSHPAVELINIWGIGPNTWQQGSGLLDANYNPKPTFFALKRLLTETWRTNVTLKTDIEGAASFRGFHGDYVATVKIADGRSHEIRFSIKPGDQPSIVREPIPR
jgi:GH35 family endo-1,4-beta-xylanase